MAGDPMTKSKKSLCAVLGLAVAAVSLTGCFYGPGYGRGPGYGPGPGPGPGYGRPPPPPPPPGYGQGPGYHQQ
jgi:hypothetical protein